MYMTNEEWEQNNQDYLKESYEETGFTAGGYAVHKLICGGCGRVFYTTIYTKKYCHSYWCGNQANNRRQREYRQMRRQDLVCQCCGEKFTPKRTGARYCSNACRQKDYRKRVTDSSRDVNLKPCSVWWVGKGAGRQWRPQNAAGILKHRPSRQARPGEVHLFSAADRQGRVVLG